jgi:cytochrome P450
MALTLSGTHLLDPAVIDEPYGFYEGLRAGAPVWEVPGTGIYTVATFQLVAEAAGRVEDFSSNINCLLYRGTDGMPCRLPFGDAGIQALATADPPMHALHRDTVFPELVAKRMAALEPDIVEIAEDCVSKALDEGPVDFMTAIGNVVPITMISRLIGFRDSPLDELLNAAFDSTAMLGSTLSYDELVALIGRTSEIERWLSHQLSVAMIQPTADLLGAVAQGIKTEAFSEYEAIVILHTLLSAGGESTTSLLGNAVRILAEHPDLQNDLRGNPELIPMFVEEALRLEPPFRYHMRFVPQDTALGGVEIPAGSTVLLLWGSANRDPEVFDKPDAIDLDRKVLRRHVAFGRGIHHCVGAPLARVEARNVLSVLLSRTRDMTLDPVHPPKWANSLMVGEFKRSAQRHPHCSGRGLTPTGGSAGAWC